MELKRCEPTQQGGSREEWRRQTLCDKLDNNMVKKKIRQASPSFKKIFPQKPENIDVKRKIAKHASNCPVTFFTHKHFFPSSPVAQTHYYRAGGRIVCKKAQTRAFKTNNLKKQQYFKENVI